MHTKKSYSYSSVCVQYQSQFCVYLPGIRLSALEECFCNSMCEMYRVLENKKYYFVIVKNNYCFCFIIMIYAIFFNFVIKCICDVCVSNKGTRSTSMYEKIGVENVYASTVMDWQR